MFRRIVVPLCLVALAPAGLQADVVIQKDGKVLGLENRINDVEITQYNAIGFLEESTGFIDREGYDGIEIKKRERDSKGTVIPWANVKDRIYSAPPEALLTGEDAMATGSYAQAIADFQAILNDKDVREVFKDRAGFNIGVCFYQLGNVKNCIAHWSSWPAKNSRYTPVVYENLGDILTAQRQFAKAREFYAKIGELEGIPEGWKLRGKLGDAKVDIAERNYDKAEQAAKQIAAQASADTVADERVLALTLQARAILTAEKADRYAEAQGLLERAAGMKAATDPAIRANLFATLGDALYKQNKLEEARYPYLRVICLYGDTGYASSALLNAGTVFLDLSQRTLDKDQAKSDDYLQSGMKLLAECAARHKGSADAREAAKRYMENKARFDKLRGEDEGGAAPAAGAGDEPDDGP